MKSVSDHINKKESNESALIDDIVQHKGTGNVAKAKLETNEKILARITDGIYRSPGSAIRELISNSYDADADNVTIETDVPRFESMTVRDDGNGMSVETLVNLIRNIGGSAKRSEKGKSLSVTDENDSTLSRVKKRKLIGKIGIGLFSVAQLTRDFEIVTKQAGDDFYLKARVKLHNHSEEYLSKVESEAELEERGASFETGDVDIWTEPTKNIDAHGTDILLHNIKQSSIDQLKSVDVWGQESAETGGSSSLEFDESDILNSSKLSIPSFHVGFLSGESGYEYFDEAKDRKPQLPWNDSDNQDVRFKKLYEGVLSLTKNTVSPKLDIVLDNYLNMLWTLGLSVPLDYIDGHPFRLSLEDIPDSYAISNKLKGQATKIEVNELTESKSFSDFLPLSTYSGSVGFNVVVDGINLYRPIKFLNLPESRAVVKKPILFLGAYTPDLSSMNIHDSAGELSFDAYILWSPKVIPRDHTGVLVRLHNASGIMFDETFMKHQVAEHTIKSQLTVEIFVNKGLDSALNIDRETFNVSHPHYQIVMRWLHQAIRQVVNKYKVIKRDLTVVSRREGQSDFLRNLSQVVDEGLLVNGVDPAEKASLHIVDEDSRDGTEIPVDSFRISTKDYKNITAFNSTGSLKSHKVEARSEALLQLLDGYGLLKELSPKQQHNLIVDILKVMSVED